MNRYPDFDKNRAFLEVMLLTEDILRNGQRRFDFVPVYEKIYRLISSGYCDKLYEAVRLRMQSYLCGEITDKLKEAEGWAFTELMARTWNDFADAAKTVDEVFVYLNAVVQRRDPHVEKVYDMALSVFRGFLSQDDDVFLRRVSRSVVLSIDASRLGHPCDDEHTCSQMLLAVCKGDREFFGGYVEDVYLEKLDMHLNFIGRIRSSVMDYVHVVRKVLDAETHRAHAYGDRRTGHVAARRVMAELVVPQMRFIVESATGLWTLMAAKRTGPVAEIYDLVMLLDEGARLVVDAVDLLAAKKYGALPVNVGYVVKLIELDDALHVCLEHSFNGHPDIERSIVASLRRLSNRDGGTTVPRCLSLHVEALLKDNRSTYAQTNRAVAMLRYVEDVGRDAFEEHYRDRLARRLVRNTGPAVVEPRERVLLNRLTVHCGAARARQMHAMVRDLDTSAALMAEYYERNRRPRVDFVLRVLDISHWPLPDEPSACALPGQVTSRFAAYQQFDTRVHGDRRKLVLMPQLCSAAMTGVFGGRAVRAHVSLFSAVVMLLFNASAALSYENISKMTGIGDQELQQSLNSLVGQCWLTKNTRGRAIKPNDVFQPCEHFKHRKVSNHGEWLIGLNRARSPNVRAEFYS